jgi:nucleoid-associated protein YgaU
MKWLRLLILAVMLGTTGCGGNTHDSSAENSQTIEADTAEVDAASGTEPLPTIEQANAQNDQVQVTPAAETPEQTPTVTEQSSSPSTASSGTGELAAYTVQKEDTLMKIAFNLYGDIRQWKNVYELNKDKLKGANHLVAGMQLKYDKPAAEPAIERNGDPYMIKAGDTLGTIADDVYAKKSKWKKLWENNRTLIKDPNKIYAGFYLYYQITEEERKEAEDIKAKRGQLGARPQQGNTPVQPGSAAPATNRAPASQ